MHGITFDYPRVFRGLTVMGSVNCPGVSCHRGNKVVCSFGSRCDYYSPMVANGVSLRNGLNASPIVMGANNGNPWAFQSPYECKKSTQLPHEPLKRHLIRKTSVNVEHGYVACLAWNGLWDWLTEMEAKRWESRGLKSKYNLSKLTQHPHKSLTRH